MVAVVVVAVVGVLLLYGNDCICRSSYGVDISIADGGVARLLAGH